MSQQVARAAPVARRRPSLFQGPTTAWARRRERLGWLLVLPSLLVVAIVALYPLVRTFLLSFTNQRLSTVRAVKFVGISHYHGDHVGQVSSLPQSTLLIGKVTDRFSFEPVLIGASVLPVIATVLVFVLIPGRSGSK